MIPATTCDTCPSGGVYRLKDCRRCLGRWLAVEDRVKPSAFQAWCKRAAAELGRGVVSAFLVEQRVRA